MANEPPDPVSKRLWITLAVLLVLLVAVGGAIALLSEG
jgi:flagellar basal body-associated protein FliL